MRDYWNDPPQSWELTNCPADKCEGTGEYLYDGKTGSVWSCDTCAYQWVIPFPIDPEPFIETDVEPTPEELNARACPHGEFNECAACDHLSDLAYDAEREQRYFGR